MKSHHLTPTALFLLLGIGLLAPIRAAAQHTPPLPPNAILPQASNPNQITAPSQISGSPQGALTPPTGIATDSNGSAEKLVSLQFPHSSVSEILQTYEELTGKRTIRDANLTGPELSINVSDQIPIHEAIALIESSLLLNGYTVIPVDDKTVKILGPSRPPRTEGLPLYLEESELPDGGDKIVSFYKPLHFLSPDEATTIISGFIQTSPYTSLIPVPNTGAIVITEKASIIRKALALLNVVDKEPTQIITEFIPLERANAEIVVETLTTMFGNSGSGGGGGVHPPAPGQPQGNPGAISSSGGDVHLLTGKPQFIAEKRTNRVLIIVNADNYKYLRELIAKLDQPTDSEQPLIRPLNYLSVSDVYPVLLTVLQGKDATNSTTGTPQTPQGQQGNPNTSGSSGGTNNASLNDTGVNLKEQELPPPQSITVGSASIITDPNANTIIVYGPPDSKAKAKEIIDILDQRPKQVYLAAVIGELQLTDGINYGASWFAKISQGGSNNLIGAAVNNTLSGVFTNLVSNGLNNAINSFPSSLAGLTVYGTVAQGLATYANFLESTGKFRTLSRPVVYTSNNKTAVISSGQKVPIPSTTQVNTTPGISGSSVNSTVAYENVNLKLSVVPLITSDHEINLQIIQHNDTIGAYVNIGGNSVPNINTQELATTVRVPSGSTIVLGGLISDDKTIDNAGIPYISKIPILGPLIGGTNKKQRTRSELVIMIQPIIVDNNDQMANASATEGGVSDLGKKAQELQNHLQPTPTPTPKKKWYHLFSLPKIDNF